MYEEPFRLRVATANLKRGGYDRRTRRHDHGKLRSMLSPLKLPPHMLCLSECTSYMDFDREPLHEVLELLSSMWGEHRDEDGRAYGSIPYVPYISDVQGSVNVPGLFVDPRYVRPVVWHHPDDSRAMLANTLEALINGHPFTLKCAHWNGSRGETGFTMQADQDGQLGSRNAFVAGDFNATSSLPGEIYPADWGAQCDEADEPWKRSQKGMRTPDGWKTNTAAIDRFTEHGWKDAGAEAADFTPTAVGGLRIDRIAWSKVSPAVLAPGSYAVHKNRMLSDHDLVTCAFDIAPAQ